MTPSSGRLVVVTQRAARVRPMMDGIRRPLLETPESSLRDPWNEAAAESSLRRALEGLLDSGRRNPAKGFGTADAEYKDAGSKATGHGVCSREEGVFLRGPAGYRNRPAPFSHEVSDAGFYRMADVRRKRAGCPFLVVGAAPGMGGRAPGKNGTVGLAARVGDFLFDTDPHSCHSEVPPNKGVWIPRSNTAVRKGPPRTRRAFCAFCFRTASSF